METYDAKQALITDRNILVRELEEAGAIKNTKQKDKYSCIHCSSSDGLSIYKSKDSNTYRYKCFSCNEDGNAIDVLMKKDNITFYQALELLCGKYSIPYEKAKVTTGIDKGKVVNFYENKFTEAVVVGDQVTALRALGEVEEAKKTNTFIAFPYVDEKDRPLKIWENVEVVLVKVGLTPVYNVISKELEILGSKTDSFNDQIIDVHSECHKFGLKITMDMLNKSINRIGSQNRFNPVIDYLQECEANYDDKGTYIEELCETLITPENFPDELKTILVTKWLINTANIAFNEGYSNTEGCLILQGSQGCGKTSWIKGIIPKEFLKTGLDLDPSNTDSIRKCIKYWVVELGELDATMKADQAKLKAFLTESVDEYRIPYAISPERFNRTTSFYGTVNKFNFLKDETGDRRYWVIPVKEVDIDKLKLIDKDQLWGEVMKLLPYYKDDLALSRDELEMLDKSNEAFRVKGKTQILIESAFKWNTPQDKWVFMQQADIARILGLTTTAGLKEALESCGAIYKPQHKIGGKRCRGYLVPPI